LCGEERYERQISPHCVVKKVMKGKISPHCVVKKVMKANITTWWGKEIYEVIKSVTVASITTPVLR
jgi:hypothetical protein